MRVFATLFVIIAAGLLAAACETLSKEECIAADWRVIGEQDGAAGHEPQNRFGAHAKACEKAGVIPDQTAWNAGYQQGLLRFCTPLRGLSHGQAGSSYANVCPPELEARFLSGYQLGLEENRKRAEINNLKGRIDAADREIDSLRDQAKKGKIDEREARRAIRRKQDDIRDWNRELGRREVELEVILDRIAYFTADPLNS